MNITLQVNDTIAEQLHTLATRRGISIEDMSREVLTRGLVSLQTSSRATKAREHIDSSPIDFGYVHPIRPTAEQMRHSPGPLLSKGPAPQRKPQPVDTLLKNDAHGDEPTDLGSLHPTIPSSRRVHVGAPLFRTKETTTPITLSPEQMEDTGSR